ncbi:MAG: cytochrome c biogenesis protein CcsA [Bacteroidales bacterium]|nr:cytochrome c biogenesis protein CcsA [Bacteroidales bacterium]
MKTLKSISFVGLILILLVLAVATVVEKLCGTNVARLFVYDSWAFFALWMVVAVSALAYILKNKMRFSSLLFHFSLLFILAGAAITWLFAQHGKIRLEQGKQSSTCLTADGGSFQLPFHLMLKEFKIDYYPGTSAPIDFVSMLQVTEDRHTEMGQVSMNHIFSYEGYRFCQNGYDPEQNATVLSVSCDPCGIGVTYSGYLLLFLSCLWLMIDKNGRFRTLLRSGVLKGGALALCAFASLTSEATPRALPKDVAEQMGGIVILHNDRMSTFQTFARDFTKKLCGSNSYKGLSAMQVVTGWMFYYDDWKREPMIKIKSGEVRRILNVETKMVSMADFINPEKGYLLDEELKQMMHGEAVADAKGVQQADEKFQIATTVATGSAIKIFPVKNKGQLAWYSQVSDDIPGDIDENKLIFVSKGLNYLNELVVKQDWKNCIKFIDKFKAYQAKEVGEDMPSASRLNAEIWFNSLDCTLVLGIASLLIGIVVFFFSTRKVAQGKTLPNRLVVSLYIIGVIFFVFLTVYLALLWYVSGHIPMSNGPETMLLMAWLSYLMMLCFARRFTLCLPFGFLVSGLTMMVAMMGETNPVITPLMPVLQSPLLSIHVAVIMMAYALLAFLMFNGVMALMLRAHAEQVQRLYVVGQMLLVPAVLLLAIGIFVGAIWANVSWGNYWSWDPKETWALITFIVYSMALHTKSLSLFGRPMFFHVFCVCAFLSVLITYFGVNFILGGMHSYA